MRALLILTVAAVVAGCATARKQDAAAQAGQAAKAEGAAGCAAPSLLVPGGIADPDGAVLYLRVPDGIEAVALDSGGTVWRTPNARWPLAVSDRYLAAGAAHSEHEVQLSLHDRKSGALLSLGPLVELGALEGMGLQAAFCGEGVIDLVWTDVKGQGSGVRADLLGRAVVGAPAYVPAAGASFRVGEAKVGELLLRSEGGQLRAYSADGLLRWERPLDAERVSSR